MYLHLHLHLHLHYIPLSTFVSIGAATLLLLGTHLCQLWLSF